MALTLERIGGQQNPLPSQGTIVCPRNVDTRHPKLTCSANERPVLDGCLVRKRCDSQCRLLADLVLSDQRGQRIAWSAFDEYRCSSGQRRCHSRRKADGLAQMLCPVAGVSCLFRREPVAGYRGHDGNPWR